jgi:hypothetical protein
VKRLEVVPFAGSAAQAPADTALVLIPRNERPLRGEAGWLDWRLCGALSALLESGYTTGSSGESTLIPIPAGRPIAARRLLLFGLGLTKNLGRRRIEQSLRRAGLTAIDLASESLALSLPGAVELELDAEAILCGLLLALEECDDAAGLRAFIPEPDELEAAGREIELRVVRLDARMQPAGDARV